MKPIKENEGLGEVRVDFEWEWTPTEKDNKLRELLPPQIPNEFGHLLTPDALWSLYVEDGEPPNEKVRR